MTCAVFAFIVDNPILDRGVVPDAWKRQPNGAAIRDALTLIPEDARVFTTNQYGSHLSHRRDIQVYCCGPGGETGLLETDLALINLQDFRIGTPERDRVMLDLALQQGFGLVYDKDGVVILQRGRGDPGAIPGLIEKWLP
jgi:hypothetical protein